MRTINWLSEPRLVAIFQKTEGPYGSPDPFECWLLHNLARSSNGRVLEIGSWRGRSACFLAEGLKAHGTRPICIDWFKGDATGGQGASLEKMQGALAEFGLEADIHNADMLSADWSILAKEVSLVFYDADHNEKPTFDVLLAIQPHLAKEAKIVVHDANFPSVAAALSNLYKTGLYRKAAYVDVWEGLEIMQKNN